MPRDARTRRICPRWLVRLEDRCTPAGMSFMPDEVVLAVRGDAPVTDFGSYLRRLGAAAAQIESAIPLLSLHGAAGYESLFHLHLTAGSDVSAAVTSLQAVPFVAWAEPNLRYDGDPRDFTPNDTQYGQQYHHPLMQNDLAWNTTFGAGITVAVTDDGVAYTHPDLSPNIWTNTDEIAGNGIDDDTNGYTDDVRGYDFSSNDADPAPVGTDTHGTHVAGIVAAKVNNAAGVAGTAGQATVMPIRFYGSGAWTSTVILNSYKYAVDNGANIVSTSYSIDGFVDNSTFRSAVQYVYDKGAIHFNSAGNNAELNPARQAFEQMIFIANTTSADKVSTSSNYGLGIDLAAPGSSILSTIINDSYGNLSGTSMSTPNAAGVAALLWSAHPEWTREQVIARMVGLADNIDGLNPTYVGYLGGGRVNSKKALLDPLPPARIGNLDEVPTENMTLYNSPTALTVRLPDKLLISTVTNAANWVLVRDGLDNTFGTGDDVTIPLTPSYSTQAPTFMLGSNAIRFTVPALPADRYQFRALASGLTDPFGTALDGDANGSAGGDFTRTFTISGAGRVTGHTPVGSVTAPVSSVTFTFASAMNTGSFSVANDVVGFFGPNGDLKNQITGFSWTNSTTLKLNLNATGTAGSYALTLGPDVFSASSIACDNDGDGTPGEAVDDRYTATFSIPTGSTVYYKHQAYPFDAALDLVAGAPGVVTLTALSSTDDANTQLPLGSNTFRFYNTTYTGSSKLFVSSNGLVAFGSGTSEWTNSDLTTVPSQPTIAAFWDDLITSRNTAPDDLVLYQFLDTDTNGTNDWLVIEWSDVRHVSTSTTNGITFQMMLQINTGTTPGEIRLNYRDLNLGSTNYSNGKSATVGIKDAGTQGPSRLLINQNSSTNPLVNSSTAIQVSPVLNLPPIAMAGGPYNVLPGGTVALSSAGTTDPDEPASYLLYQWDLDGDGLYAESGTNALNGDERGPSPTYAAGTPGGVFPLSLRVTDSAGAKHTVATTVNVVAPPTIPGVVIGDGSASRSRITSLTVNFDQVVTLSPTAFTLTGPGGTVPLTVDTSGSLPTQTVAKLTFSGPGVEFDSLVDGKYTLSIGASEVTGAGGLNLDGNGDGTAGDDYTLAFHRLFGDADGDGDVDSTDFGALRTVFGAASPIFDFDNDGDVDASDFGAFRVRFGTIV